VRRAVKREYPSVEVTEKIEDEDDLDDRMEKLDEAQAALREAIDLIEEAIDDADLEDHATAYLVDQLKVHLDSSHGFLSDDYNIEKLKEDLREEFEETGEEEKEEGEVTEKRKVKMKKYMKKLKKKLPKKVKIKDSTGV
jgi:SpoVK/Ycf46/Vps4 family AAA+-type ATPase